jgi:hypothetical protein
VTGEGAVGRTNPVSGSPLFRPSRSAMSTFSHKGRRLERESTATFSHEGRRLRIEDRTKHV